MNKLYIFLLLSICCLRLQAQEEYYISLDNSISSHPLNTEIGYYITKEKKVVHIRIAQSLLWERTEKVVIPEQIGHEYTIFTPEDIIGYGFEDGTRYISADVRFPEENKRCFLRELIKDDNLSLYVCTTQEDTKYIFQKKDGELKIITDKGRDYRNYLRELSGDCSDRTKIDTHPMKMNDYSMIRMYHAYTECNARYFQRFQFGLTAGAVYDAYHIKGDQDYKSEPAITYNIGIFCQIPLDDKFSFHPEINYSNEKITGKTKNKKLPEKNTYKRSSLQIPLLFRYTMNQFKSKVIPYVELGAYVDIRLSGSLSPVFLVGLSGEEYVTYEVSPALYGACLGAGIEYPITSKHSFYAGLRYTPSMGKTKQDQKEIHNTVSLQVAIGF